MKCPFAALTPVNRAVTDNNALWFPERLNLSILKDRPTNHPFPDFDYPQAFAQLDLQAVQTDIESVLTTSQEWWPADYGHYGGLFIRQAWHQAGTYRVSDGRGGANTGNQRFPPLNSWPDNANLDKARRLLWPIKKKYGQALSWADLFMLTGNQALQSMGVEPFGFGGGRIDTYSPEDDVYWGPETELLDNERYHVESGTLDEPFGASVMGLIYVNPEGPNGDPNPAESAQEIRATFRNMAMNDEETVALIAGGHTFGKSHGVASETNQGPSPEVAGLELQGLGYAAGKGKDTITSGIEGAWTQNPTQWDNQYFNNLFNYEWECHEGPGGRSQWRPIGDDIELVPDAHVPGKFDKPMMMTTDISLKVDPEYRKIAKRFHENPDQLKQVFARVWYKLTHRDMGPATRLVGADVAPPQIWQDPIPSCDHPLLNDQDRDLLSQAILDHDELTIPKLVRVAWGSASTFRRTDYRGGANGARIRLRPQKDWAVNQPQELSQVLSVLQSIQKDFNDGQQKNGSDKRVSMADLIVLGGCTAIQSAAHQAGHTTVRVPFVPGRMDASMEETDADAFDPLEPKSDGFRNHYDPDSGYGRKPEEILVDRAHLLGLTAPEMTVLVGGLRALGATTSDKVGLLTEKPGQLSNDFFVNLLDMETEWSETKDSNNLFEGRDRSTGDLKWQGSRVDLIFGSHSELRAISEFYACSDSEAKFVTDFVGAWTKVMNADRYDLDNRLLPNSVENRLNSQSHQEAALV